jgi:hypothetical protein
MADLNDTTQNATADIVEAPIPASPPDRAPPPDELPPEPSAADFGGDNGGSAASAETLRHDAQNTTEQGSIPGLKPGWLAKAAEEVAKKAAEEGGGDAPARGADGKFLPKAGDAKAADAKEDGNGVTDAAKGSLDAAAAAANATGTPPTSDALKELEADLKGAKLNGREKKRYEKWLDTMKSEREQFATAKREADEWKRKAEEVETKLSSRPSVTPEIEQELAALRDRSRRFDITTDPKFVKEYDAPVKSNEDKILATLEDIGRSEKLPEDKIKQLVSEYGRDGLTFDTLGHVIASLQKNGAHGKAAQLTALIGRADELRGARQNALEEHAKAIQADATKYAEMQAQQAEQQQKFSQRASAAINESFAANEAAMKKLLPSFLAPEPPLATDNPATAAAKKAARADYDAAVNAARTDFARYAPDPSDPEKTAKLTGEFNSLAIFGLLAKQHLLPKLAAQLAERGKAVAAVNAKLASVRTAGTVHQQRVASSGDSPESQQRAIARDSDGKPKPGWLKEMVMGR